MWILLETRTYIFFRVSQNPDIDICPTNDIILAYLSCISGMDFSDLRSTKLPADKWALPDWFAIGKINETISAESVCILANDGLLTMNSATTYFDKLNNAIGNYTNINGIYKPARAHTRKALSAIFNIDPYDLQSKIDAISNIKEELIVDEQILSTYPMESKNSAA